MATRIALASAALLAAASVSQAAFVETVSFTAGAPNVDTTKAHWNNFFDDNATTTTVEDNSPDVAYYNPNGQTTLAETTGAIVAGSFNIYSPATAANFVVNVPVRDTAAAENITAVLQLRTQGVPINPASLKLAGLSPVSSVQLSSTTVTIPAGPNVITATIVDTWYLFNLPNAAYSNDDLLADTLTLNFTASSTNFSLDQLRLDTVSRAGAFLNEPTPIPEPAALGLLSLGGLALLRRKR